MTPFASASMSSLVISGALWKKSRSARFQLRHHNGPVHTIPYGEILTLTNWSRDWSIMKFELRIAFETDIDQVRKIIKQIGIDMFEDPQFGPLDAGADEIPGR